MSDDDDDCSRLVKADPRTTAGDSDVSLTRLQVPNNVLSSCIIIVFDLDQNHLARQSDSNEPSYETIPNQ